MPRYRARVEFRRQDDSARWVLAGVHVGGEFFAAIEGVERLRSRLPTAVVGWSDLPTDVVAADRRSAAAAALEVARGTWPERVAALVPWPLGTPERP